VLFAGVLLFLFFISQLFDSDTKDKFRQADAAKAPAQAGLITGKTAGNAAEKQTGENNRPVVAKGHSA